MIEYGVIKIRRKINRDDLLERIKEISEKLGEGYEYNSATHITEEGYLVVDLRKVFLGNKICVALCRNSKGRISLLSILNRDVNDKLLDTLVLGLTEFTGGKFHKS